MTEGTEVYALPYRWAKNIPGFPEDRTVTAHVGPSLPGGAFYRITGEALGALMKDAGWKPVEGTE